MVIGLWVTTTKRVSVRRRMSSRSAQKRSTLASSSGASTSSSTQIGDGLVRNTAKISASAVSACSPPESSVIDLRALARRPRDDLEPRLQRIVGAGQRKLGRAAAEEMLEEAGEMAVHRLEGREQPLAALAVQVLDALPQALDRLFEILVLAPHLAEPRLELAASPPRRGD